jgi:hypothetical protein
MSFGRTLFHIITSLTDNPAEPLPTDVVKNIFGTAVPGEVDDECLPDEVLLLHKAPKSAVMAPVSVVAHNKVAPLGYYYWAKVVARRVLTGNDIVVREIGMGIIDPLTIDVNLLIPDLNRVPFLCDQPLDKILVPVERIAEDYDITPFRCAYVENYLVEEGYFHYVG